MERIGVEQYCHSPCALHCLVSFVATLATNNRLLLFGVAIDSVCVFSTKMDESICHLFFDCEPVRDVWQALLKWLGRSRAIGDWNHKVPLICQHIKGEESGLQGLSYKTSFMPFGVKGIVFFFKE